MVVAGLVLGIPLGTVTGAIAWRLVAEGLGVAPDTAIPVVGIALIVPVAVLFGILAAYLPARAAAHTQPGGHAPLRLSGRCTARCPRGRR